MLESWLRKEVILVLYRLQAFDLWLIEKIFEKFAQWLQRWTTLDNFFLAKLSALVFFVAAVWQRGPRSTPVYFLISFVLFVLVSVWEKIVYSLLGGNCSNPLKGYIAAVWLRLSLVLPTFVIWWWEQEPFPILYIYTYFLSCDPLPPQRVRAWELLSSFFRREAETHAG